MIASSVQPTETLDGLELDVTPIRALLEKQVLELSDEEVEKVVVLRHQLAETGPQLASRVVRIRLALQSLNDRLAEIEEATELTGSSVGLGQALDGLSTATRLLRTLSEEDLEAFRLATLGQAKSSEHVPLAVDGAPPVGLTDDSADALYHDDRGSTGLSLFKPSVFSRFRKA